jgi:excisionase family DNA binding protein
MPIAQVEKPPVDQVLTYEQVADALQIGLTKAKELCASGAIKKIKIGRHVRVRARDLEAYLDSQTS